MTLLPFIKYPVKKPMPLLKKSNISKPIKKALKNSITNAIFISGTLRAINHLTSSIIFSSKELMQLYLFLTGKVKLHLTK